MSQTELQGSCPPYRSSVCIGFCKIFQNGYECPGKCFISLVFGSLILCTTLSACCFLNLSARILADLLPTLKYAESELVLKHPTLGSVSES